MKNNEILIVVQPEDASSVYNQIILKVDSNISYDQLKEGIAYGLKKHLQIEPPAEWNIVNTIETGLNDPGLSLRELGFVSGTILNRSGKGETWFFKESILESQLFNKRYRYELENKNLPNTMKYNIYNRIVTEMEETVIDILSPGNPPQPSRNSIWDTIIPIAVSFGTMYGLRSVFVDNAANGMMLFMCFSVLGTFLAQICRHFISMHRLRQSRDAWKMNYENYLKRVCNQIEEYQELDVKYLNECFPSIDKLIQDINFIRIPLFSRSVHDFDFMNLRVGNSNQVPSLFTIHHEVKEEIELGVSFYEEDNEIKVNLPNDNISAAPKWLVQIISWISKKIQKKDSFPEKDEHKIVGYLNELSEYLATVKYPFLRQAIITDKENNESTLYPPLIVDFKNCGAMGCVNFENSRSNLLNHIILDLASNHNPKDLQFVFFFKPEKDEKRREKRIDNYKCLPHFNELFNDMSQFVFDENDAGSVFSRLESIMNERILEQKNAEDEKITYNDYCQIVCIFEYDYNLKEKAFSKYLPDPPSKGEQYVNKNGLTFIFAVDCKELLPHYCGIILERSREFDSGKIIFRNQILNRNSCHNKRLYDDNTTFTYEQEFKDKYVFSQESAIRNDYYKAFSQLSAFYTLHIRERGTVPDSVSLFDLYDDLKNVCEGTKEHSRIIEVIKEFIKKRWNETKEDINKTLSVPIGIGESDIVNLDLHENADGPHMLVAGTTGYGKSETMLTYLIGLCINYSPQYLNLILVDMKGNSFAGRLRELPHLLATVDDVSSESNGISPVYTLKRFLELLTAEIQRRKIIFREYDVDRLDYYIEVQNKITSLLNNYGDVAESGLSSIQQDRFYELQKSGEFPPVLGHLVLVVDEFTELKRFSSENDTDYIGELTSIARVGRTLGLHMILVSQNIENAITDDIRINTRSRICLKVATRSASKEMLDGRTDAFYSDMPRGRAYFLVGSGTKYEYFQSGYASENLEKIEESKTEITMFNTSGNHTTFYDSYKDKDELKVRVNNLRSDNTQLNAVIEAIKQIKKENATHNLYHEPDMVFQKPLDSIIRYNEFLSELNDNAQTSSQQT
ncbi:MAG: hypothetical protein K5895_13640 [Lachnospiraceae bacterium]|nr:hypothetical protein [Lachnospiraceae bacterium]